MHSGARGGMFHLCYKLAITAHEVGGERAIYIIKNNDLVPLDGEDNQDFLRRMEKMGFGPASDDEDEDALVFGAVRGPDLVLVLARARARGTLWDRPRVGENNCRVGE